MEVFLLVIVGWVFSVCLHEFGHAITAYRGGDYTVRDKGYLTLNPLRYTHPIYSLVMPLVFVLLGGIGLPGGAVYINDHLLRSRQWRTAVSLAGPAMNVVLALVLCIPFWLGIIQQDQATSLAVGLAFLVQLQISAVVLNLLPIPPLDGFQAIAPWLPRHLERRFIEHSNTGIFVLFILMWYVPVANRTFWNVIDGTAAFLGISPELASLGWQSFRFWEGNP